MYVTRSCFSQRGVVYRCEQSLDLVSTCRLWCSSLFRISKRVYTPQCIYWTLYYKSTNDVTSTVARIVTLNSSERAIRFGATYRFHPQAQLAACFCRLLAWLTLRSWKWMWYIASKYRVVSELQAVTTQKTVLFIITSVRSSNPTRNDK
jgi:hypothetical protein